MKYIKDFINQYAPSMIHTLCITLFSYIGVEIKRLYHQYIIDKTKKEVIKNVCMAIQQIYPNLDSTDKLNKAIKNTREILKEKNINISNLELRMYIESTVYYFKNS